jgi:hypothetical protein
MKKFLFTIAVLLIASSAVKADPAKKVNLTYLNGKLKIEAIHKVKDVKTHYIDQIIIRIDGKAVQTIQPKEQSSNLSQVVEVSLPNLKKGSQIEVSTRCNEFGKKTGKLTL